MLKYLDMGELLLTFGDSIKFDSRVKDKIERGFYWNNKKRKEVLEGIRRLAPSQYNAELRRLRIRK